MSSIPGNIIINSCEYTPVYLIQDSNIAQWSSYVLPSNGPTAGKPAMTDLKSFYENSGNLENAAMFTQSENVPKPNVTRKSQNAATGNNLKIANYVLSNNEEGIALKPTVAISSKIVKVDFASYAGHVRKKKRMTNLKTLNTGTEVKILPKIVPKEINTNMASNKLTSVQLLKLGETYHSLNHLSSEQMKVVHRALKSIGDPRTAPPEPYYDPLTNTRFIYKVVSPKDLAVVGNNKLLINSKCEKKSHAAGKKTKHAESTEPELDEMADEEVPTEPKVTRSGRVVKLPRQIVLEQMQRQRARKKNTTVVSCFQCAAEFCSLYRLHRHYERYPTHIPAKIHSNLFHCLLAIIKSSPQEDRANIFIHQLENLITKLKSLLPCLLKKIGGIEGHLCTINDDVGRLFGMNPGKYNLSMDALDCNKDKDGYCKHNPAKNHFNSDLSKPSQLWLSKHNEEVANTGSPADDCARINSAVKWPTVGKRIWKRKQKHSMPNKKKTKLEHVENNNKLVLSVKNSAIDSKSEIVDNVTQKSVEETIAGPKKKSAHAQFKSAHFDIRSSPIKSSAAVYRFQLDPAKLATCEVQFIKPLALKQYADDPAGAGVKKSIESQKVLKIKHEEVIGNINVPIKSWQIHSEENYMKSSSLIEPALLHVKDNFVNTSDGISEENNQLVDRTPNNGQTMLNFLDSLGSDCLSYPEAEIRNNSDFQLDLFPFSHSS